MKINVGWKEIANDVLDIILSKIKIMISFKDDLKCIKFIGNKFSQIKVKQNQKIKLFQFIGEVGSN